MSDSDLNIEKNTKRKKRSPVQIKLARTRAEVKAAQKKFRSDVEVDVIPFSGESNSEIVLTGRGDTRFEMSLEEDSTLPTGACALPLTTNTNVTRPTSMIQSQNNYQFPRDDRTRQMDEAISRAVEAAEVNLKIKHHEELDGLRKQLNDLKLKMSKNAPTVIPQPTSNIPSRERRNHTHEDMNGNLPLKHSMNPNASVFTNSRPPISHSTNPSLLNPYLQYPSSNGPPAYNQQYPANVSLHPNPMPNYNFPNFANPPPQPNVESRHNNSGFRMNDSFTSHHPKSLPIHKWKIKFNGDGSVKQFLFKVDALRRKNHFDEDEVYNNFDLLLEGRAESFFWRFQSMNPTARYPHFIRAFSTEFGSAVKDCMISATIAQTRQGMNQSFTDFLERMRLLLDSMEQPMDDAQFIHLVKSNCIPDLSNIMFPMQIFSKESLSRHGREAEQQLQYQQQFYKSYVPKFAPRRVVSEMSIDENDLSSRIEELEASISALKFQNRQKKNKDTDEEEITGCFNCRSTEHFQKDCPEDVTDIYCFRCGRRGVITPKCPKCRPKNRRVDDVVPTSHRQNES